MISVVEGFGAVIRDVVVPDLSALLEEMTDELFAAIRENPVVRVPSDFVLVGRSFALLSGTAHTLGRRANVLAAMGVARVAAGPCALSLKETSTSAVSS